MGTNSRGAWPWIILIASIISLCASGLATGPHLHYEYRIRGIHKNPQTVPLPDAEPIPSADLDRFMVATADLVNVLDLPAGPVLVAR
jgi:hypothetical protein